MWRRSLFRPTARADCRFETEATYAISRHQRAAANRFENRIASAGGRDSPSAVGPIDPASAQIMARCRDVAAAAARAPGRHLHRDYHSPAKRRSAVLGIAKSVVEREDRRWQNACGSGVSPLSGVRVRDREGRRRQQASTKLEERVAALEAEEQKPAGENKTGSSPLPPLPPAPPADPDYVFEERRRPGKPSAQSPRRSRRLARH